MRTNTEKSYKPIIGKCKAFCPLTADLETRPIGMSLQWI